MATTRASETVHEAPVLPLLPRASEGPDAQLVGVLVLNGSCLTVEHPDGGSNLVAWPAGTHWDEQHNAVVLDGSRIAVGDRVELGGGELHVDATNVDNLDWVVAPAPQCLPANVWLTALPADRLGTAGEVVGLSHFSR